MVECKSYKGETTMLDENDHKEIAHIMKVVIESDIAPRFDLVMEGYQSVQERLNIVQNEISFVRDEAQVEFNFVRDELQLIKDKLIPTSRIEELEDEVKLLKVVVRQLSEDLQQLKKA